jgi:hypothetical protein
MFFRFFVVPVTGASASQHGAVHGGATQPITCAQANGRKCLLQKDVITAACNKSDNRTAPQSYWLENSPTNALRSSERALKTVNREKNTRVVKAIVCV